MPNPGLGSEVNLSLLWWVGGVILPTFMLVWYSTMTETSYRRGFILACSFGEIESIMVGMPGNSQE